MNKLPYSLNISRGEGIFADFTILGLPVGLQQIFNSFGYSFVIWILNLPFGYLFTSILQVFTVKIYKYFREKVAG